MSEVALLPAQVDEFGGRIPEPSESFSNRVVHPRNIAIDARRDSAALLKPAQVRRMASEARQLDKALQAGDYYGLKDQFKLLIKRLNLYEAELESLRANTDDWPEPEREHELMQLIHSVQNESLIIRQQIDALAPSAARYKQLVQVIKDHHLAVERQKLHHRLTKELADEALKFAEIIIERWAQLGYKHEYMLKNRRYVDKVAFAAIEVTPDSIWFKIAVSRKSWFGFKSTLPNSVRVLDLIDDDVLKELSFACQRQVTAKSTFTNGAWIKVNRIGTTDGLLNYVTLQQVLNNYPHEDRPLLPIGFGVEDGRVISWVHLCKHPHFLIGGSTGGGKSNAINVVICTLIQKHSPNEVQFCLIDLKEGLEFQRFESIPHLLIPVVKEVEDAEEVLRQLEAERKERALSLGRAGARDIDEYNAKSEKPMPRIVIIFDEYAAIKTRKDVEQSIQQSVMQLSAKGRACGVHLILCTQNPSVEIVPGPSKANMAFRLAGAMPTISASMTILGVGDAAKLPDIRGRMLAMCGAKIWQLQTPHVRDSDLQTAIHYSLKYREESTDELTHIELPEPITTLNFNDVELVTIMLNDFDGVTSTRKIFDVIKDSTSVTFSQLSEQMQRLIAKGRIEHKGQLYEFVKYGKGWRLTLVNDAQPEAILEPENTKT